MGHGSVTAGGTILYEFLLSNQKDLSEGYVEGDSGERVLILDPINRRSKWRHLISAIFHWVSLLYCQLESVVVSVDDWPPLDLLPFPDVPRGEADEAALAPVRPQPVPRDALPGRRERLRVGLHGLGGGAGARAGHADHRHAVMVRKEQRN